MVQLWIAHSETDFPLIAELLCSYEFVPRDTQAQHDMVTR